MNSSFTRAEAWGNGEAAAELSGGRAIAAVIAGMTKTLGFEFASDEKLAALCYNIPLELNTM